MKDGEEGRRSTGRRKRSMRRNRKKIISGYIYMMKISRPWQRRNTKEEYEEYEEERRR